MSDQAQVLQVPIDLNRPPVHPKAEKENGICDPQFMDDVAQLKALRSYMMRQAKSAQAGTIELGDLNLLRFDPKGRFPTCFEWSSLEHQSNNLYQHLAEPDRRRFLYGQIPYVVVRNAGILGVVAFGSLVAGVACSLFHEQMNQSSVKLGQFLSFLFWAAALGGIGSIAFIGMNALAVQEDATFDLLNKKLIRLRVTLGALFAVVLSLPYGFEPFHTFIMKLFGDMDKVSSSELALKSLFLLLPFILGFSTSLVIMILNQFVEAVQSFFGKRSSPTPIAPPPAPVGSAAVSAPAAPPAPAPLAAVPAHI